MTVTPDDLDLGTHRLRIATAGQGPPHVVCPGGIVAMTVTRAVVSPGGGRMTDTLAARIEAGWRYHVNARRRRP